MIYYLTMDWTKWEIGGLFFVVFLKWRLRLYLMLNESNWHIVTTQVVVAYFVDGIYNLHERFEPMACNLRQSERRLSTMSNISISSSAIT